jgi:hypothetical protein
VSPRRSYSQFSDGSFRHGGTFTLLCTLTLKRTSDGVSPSIFSVSSQKFASSAFFDGGTPSPRRSADLTWGAGGAYDIGSSLTSGRSHQAAGLNNMLLELREPREIRGRFRHGNGLRPLNQPLCSNRRGKAGGRHETRSPDIAPTMLIRPVQTGRFAGKAKDEARLFRVCGTMKNP